MGCSNSKSIIAKESEMHTNNAEPIKTEKQDFPASESFTIPLDDDVKSLSETVRQPPKRIQELMRQAEEVEPTTLEELHEKQERAELRRQELLQQKVENIQKTAQMLQGRAGGGDGEDIDLNSTRITQNQN